MIDYAAAETIFEDFKEISYEHIDYQLYETVKDYKARIASKFSSISRDEVNKIQGSEFYISLKLDGEHSQLYFEDGKACLLRPRGYAYIGLPLLDDAATILKDAGIKRALFPGELYVDRNDGKRTRIFDVLSLTKGPKSQEDLKHLCFAPFDIIFLDDEEFIDYSEVLKRIAQIFEKTALEPPPTKVSNNIQDIHKYYHQWVNEEGAEGLMIRTDLTYRYKLKAEHTVDAVIIGYTSKDEMITSVLTGLVNEDGTIQVLTSIEKGFSDVQRLELYQKLIRLKATSSFFEVSSYCVPYTMVQPRIIIEFTSNDMVAETTHGRPIKKATLNLKDHHYSLLRSTPLVSMAHCVFQRFRDDKDINAVDLRVTQITDHIFIDLAENPSQDIRFPDVTIIKRKVWTKEAKNKLSVRKIVIWKTNKEDIDSAYSAYVLNYTDFSPARQEPLKQDVRISNSERQILQLAEEFEEKHIKKGWQAVDGAA